MVTHHGHEQETQPSVIYVR